MQDVLLENWDRLAENTLDQLQGELWVPGPGLGTVLLVSLHTQAKGVSPADIGYLMQTRAMQLPSQDL